MTEATDKTWRGFLDMAHDFRQGQPPAMMATEFLENPRVFEEIERFSGTPTKLLGAVREMRSHLAGISDFWWTPPQHVENIMRALDWEIRSTSSDKEAAKLIYKALFEADPPSFENA